MLTATSTTARQLQHGSQEGDRRGQAASRGGRDVHVSTVFSVAHAAERLRRWDVLSSDSLGVLDASFLELSLCRGLALQ